MAKLPDGFVAIVELNGTTVTIREKDLVMCRSCCFYAHGKNEIDAWSDCKLHNMHVSENDWCSWAVKREVSGNG